ncbi:hypothetical protein [Methylobacterium sp. J-068]|uniref:hypothetical protein n=1 Tax=Methylobacterium sp. J-068 TaxID=2836649 RepID=UPI001FB957E8|nr:hypothetical protein [Methylobacterium sp. J-068]MCJ2036934.1 hypothetical protein [Methylobacterium sp. J-068]
MTSKAANRDRPDNLTDPDPGAHGRFDARARRDVVAANPRWLKLGLAGALGIVAGTMLFATRAEGETRGRTEGRRRGPR